jgi:hypothetical protein
MFTARLRRNEGGAKTQRTTLATPLLLLHDITAYVMRSSAACTGHYLATAVPLPPQFLLWPNTPQYVQKQIPAEIRAKFMWSLQQMFYVVPMHFSTTFSSPFTKVPILSKIPGFTRISWRALSTRCCTVILLSHWLVLNTPKSLGAPLTAKNPED